MVGSGVAGLVSALLALREGRVLLIARAGFARNIPARVDSVPVVTIAALIELGVDPRTFSDLRVHDSRLVSWSGGAPATIASPGTVHVERGALEAALFARVLRHPRLTLAPAPRSRAVLRSMVDPHVRRGGVVLDATGRASVLAAQRVTAPSPWYARTSLWRAQQSHSFEPGFRIATLADGYCYRLGTRDCLTLGIVTSERGQHSRHADRSDACRVALPWLYDGVPPWEAPSTDRAHVASVQWATHAGAIAVGDAGLARDALSSQGLACTISEARYAVAVESRGDAALYEARAQEQRGSHLRSLHSMLSESHHVTETRWQSYRTFIARAIEAPPGNGDPVVALRGRRLVTVADAMPLGHQ